MPRWWLTHAFVALLGMASGCSPFSSSSATSNSMPPTTAAFEADFVMVNGEGPGELADRIASQGLQREDGSLRTLLSAEHTGTLELPARTIRVVEYQTGREGDTLPCVAVATDDGERESVGHECGTSLPESIGSLRFESGGSMEVLIMRVSPETEMVVVMTSDRRRFTARPAGRVAYLEWSISGGRGNQVIGLDANGDQLLSRVLPGA